MQEQPNVIDAKFLDVETGLPEVHSSPTKGEPSVVKDVKNEQTKEKKEEINYRRSVVCSKSYLLKVLLSLIAFTSYLVWQRRRNREIVEITDYTDSIEHQPFDDNEFFIEEPSENANVVNKTGGDHPINDSIIQDSDEDIPNIGLEEATAKAREASERLENYFINLITLRIYDPASAEVSTITDLIEAKGKADRILNHIRLRSPRNTGEVSTKI